MKTRSARFRAGAVIPSVNRIFEQDARAVASRGVDIHVARWRTAKSHEEAQVALTLLPEIFASLDDAAPDVVAFACTAGSAYGGRAAEASILGMIEDSGAPRGITTAGALARSCMAQQLSRLLFVSPFDHAYAAPEADGLTDLGANIVRIDGWDMRTARDCDGIDVDQIVRRTIAADGADVDGIIISCANVRGVEAAPLVAAALGKPVLSSNQALLDELVALAAAHA